MKILKIGLLAFFVTATPLLMFRQAVIISNRQEDIAHLEIRHIRDSADWALKHSIDSIALVTEREKKIPISPGPVTVTVDYSKLPKYPDFRELIDTILKRINNSRNSDTAVSNAINILGKNHRDGMDSIVRILRERIYEKEPSRRPDPVGDLGLAHADTILSKINKISEGQKRKWRLSDEEIGFLKQLLRLLRDR